MFDRRAFLQALGSAGACALLPPIAGSRARGGIANGSSPPAHANYIGANLAGIDYYSSELPFLNLLKMAGASGNLATSGWQTLSAGGAGTGEEGWLQTDSDGYATSLVAGNGFVGTQQFTYIQTQLVTSVNQPSGVTYPYGYANIVYRLQFTGTGTITVSRDPTSGTGTGTNGLTLTNAGTGTVSMTFTVATPSVGISVSVTSIGASSYPHNISVVDNTQAASYDAGAIFNPSFLTSLAPYSRIRPMDWLQTNNMMHSGYFTGAVSVGATTATLSSNWPFLSGTISTLLGNGDAGDTPQLVNVTYTFGSATVTFPALAHAISSGYFNVFNQTYTSWSTRPMQSNCFWSCIQGVPYEVCIALANKLSVDLWLCVPVWANSYSGETSFWTSLATLVYGSLNSNLKCYYEFSNEVWNSSFTQCHYSYLVGNAVFPGPGNIAYEAQEWMGTQVAQMADAIYAVYGSTAFANQVVVTMGGQNAGYQNSQYGYGSYYMNAAMNTPDWTSRAYTHHIGAIHYAWYAPDSQPSNTDCSAIAATANPLNTFFGLAYSNTYGGTTYSSIGSQGMFGQSIADTATIFPFLSGVWAPGGASAVPILGYEGGTNFLNNGVTAWVSLWTSALRDTRMKYVYYDPDHVLSTNPGILPGYVAIGYSTLNQYFDCGPASGNWEAIESVQQSLSPLSGAPPKYQGIANFAAAAA